MPPAESATRALQTNLAQLPLFAHLDSETLALLASDSIRREFAPGETVFHEGEPAAGLYVLETGWVRAFKMSPQGREQVLQFVGPGEPFNTVAIFTNLLSPATAVALEASVVWVVPRATVRRILRERPEFAERVLENMAERMIYLVGLVADLSLRTVSARLASLLLERAEDGVLSRPKWFTHAELAARLGTVPDVIQRALGRLQSERVIDVSRREIRILDEGRLRSLAD
ncbi:MAG: Crp/Fnr family transcriptional regulator [Dehalococcoidia bacterium]|nr:Crp/Fnr family transcriptional regulator [Dehalococcoidia bacterium]